MASLLGGALVGLLLNSFCSGASGGTAAPSPTEPNIIYNTEESETSAIVPPAADAPQSTWEAYYAAIAEARKVDAETQSPGKATFDKTWKDWYNSRPNQMDPEYVLSGYPQGGWTGKPTDVQVAEHFKNDCVAWRSRKPNPSDYGLPSNYYPAGFADPGYPSHSKFDATNPFANVFFGW